MKSIGHTIVNRYAEFAYKIIDLGSFSFLLMAIFSYLTWIILPLFPLAHWLNISIESILYKILPLMTDFDKVYIFLTSILLPAVAYASYLAGKALKKIWARSPKQFLLLLAMILGYPLISLVTYLFLSSIVHLPLDPNDSGKLYSQLVYTYTAIGICVAMYFIAHLIKAAIRFRLKTMGYTPKQPGG